MSCADWPVYRRGLCEACWKTLIQTPVAKCVVCLDVPAYAKNSRGKDLCANCYRGYLTVGRGAEMDRKIGIALSPLIILAGVTALLFPAILLNVPAWCGWLYISLGAITLGIGYAEWRRFSSVVG